MGKKIELTTEDFQFFKSCCNYWIDKFGLRDWQFFFTFREFDDDNWASTTPDVLSMTTTINLEPVWTGLTEEDLGESVNEILKHTALHEIVHNLVAPLLFIAREHRDDMDLINATEHALTMRLCNVLLNGEGI